MIDRDGSTVMSSLYYYGSMQADWSIHGGESAGVRGSGMIKALFFCFFLFFYITSIKSYNIIQILHL